MMIANSPMSKAKFFRKVFAGTQESQRLQSNIEDAVTAALKNPLLDGRLLNDVALISGNTKIEHKLDRKIRGYLVVRKSVAANIYDVSNDDLFLTLNSSAAVTVSIWVF